MWVPPEQKDPILLHAPTRRSVALFGAVNVRNGRLISMITSQFDADSFEAFLGLLLRHRSRSRRMVAVLDNAPYHRAESLQPYLEKHRAHLQLAYLPPYSPELNPIERVWKLLRKLRTHNEYFDKLEHLITAVSEQLTAWYWPNKTLAKLCCII